MAQEIEGEYETTTEQTAARLTADVLDMLGVPEARYPANDPIKNTAKQAPGLDKNAYSQNSRYLPDTPEGMNNEHKAAAHFERFDDRKVACATMTEYALETLMTEENAEQLPPAYWVGTTMTICEKFGWKMDMIEQAVKSRLLDVTSVEEYDTEKDIVTLESDKEDIVLSVDGERVSFQVKTGNGATGDADYRIQVTDYDIDSRDITFEVR